MHKVSKQRYYITLWMIVLAITAVIFYSLMAGTFQLSVIDVIKTLLRIDENREYDLVIFDFRLPRILIACLVGIGLGIAGAVIQGVTKNGLADPGILGINAGAGTAVVLFMFFFHSLFQGMTWLSIMAMPLFGLVGGLLAALIIFAFSWKNGSLDVERLILTGIAIGSAFGAVSLYLSLKMKATDFEMVVVWITGSIYDANWLYILAMAPWLFICIPIILKKAYILDLLQLEDSSAISLGIAINKEKSILLLSSIGLISACVSVSGSIGFIGLMAPHISRYLVGVQNRFVIPVSAAIGALLVVSSDYIAKTIIAPAELPVGIIVSIIGVPFFLYLLKKAKA